ncbi:hypothetical protein JWJ90_03220 [Desulfobulbus rhabdoformis]|jgi:chromosome segregation ATPase|uniref:hypothetical protein n=1 Tax=Desulfobulbus rhabdoformis TaxID=34032 RepID=UPI001966B69B|nr:hypothetical protein [Desulfobulbus rhabdoformis]MBM9613292.1 hypothetical protein [Desulfobulbus rhabdoformis]
MKLNTRLIVVVCCTLLLAGCAGQTTDPHQGGLFSYNPNAYEQRLQDRRSHLDQVEERNRQEQAQSTALQSERATRQKEMASLRRQVRKLNTSIASLEKDVLAKEATSVAQQQKRTHILAKLKELKASSRNSDFIEDPASKRLEIKRLQKRRDQLEKEAASLMFL